MHKQQPRTRTPLSLPNTYLNSQPLAESLGNRQTVKMFARHVSADPLKSLTLPTYLTIFANNNNKNNNKQRFRIHNHIIIHQSRSRHGRRRRRGLRRR